MLLDAAITPTTDPAAAAGTALGSFLAGLAASGPVGALIAAALGALVVLSGLRLYHTVKNPPLQPQVTVTPTPEASAAAARAAAEVAPPACGDCRALTGKVERVEGRLDDVEGRLDAAEAWQVEHLHRHEVDAVAARAREEGAREERERREPTHPGGRRR